MNRRHGLTERGQALVEFALVLPLIFLLIFATVDFGRAIYFYNTMSEASRQANRTAIVDQTLTTIRTVAISAAPAVPMVPADVTVCYKTALTLETDCSNPGTDDCSASLDIGCLAIVTTVATYRPITPVISGIVGNLTLSSTSVGPIEYVCPTASHPTCP